MTMIDKRVIIAALARDCNESLVRNIPRIEALRSHFASSRVVVVENDSVDGTKTTLQAWASQKKNVDLIMDDFGTETIPRPSAAHPHPSTSLHRIEKMARYRNIYLDHVRSTEPQPDILIVVDIDVKGFSVEGVIETIENAPLDWGALFANGSLFYRGRFPYMFDQYAYLPLGCAEVPGRKKDELFYESKRATRDIRRHSYVKCLSAFGGIGVYKWDAIKSLRYGAFPNARSRTFEAMCEHVSFNMAVAAQGYGNYVGRAMRVDYGSRSFKHLLSFSLLPNFVFRWIYALKNGEAFSD